MPALLTPPLTSSLWVPGIIAGRKPGGHHSTPRLSIIRFVSYFHFCLRELSFHVLEIETFFLNIRF